jgi:hypothetical protein
VLLELAVGIVLVGACLYGYALTRRARLYTALRRKLNDILLHSPAENWTVPGPVAMSSNLAVVPSFLPADQFERILRELSALVSVERGYIPTRRKAGTIAYETLIQSAPEITGFYHSIALKRFLSATAQLDLVPTPIRDQNSLSLLIYDRPGDHIGFHHDLNFYRGRHFTVILCLVNRGTAPNGLSHAGFVVSRDGNEEQVRAAPNTLIFFEGNKVYHKVTPINDNERRVVMSMTFCTEPTARFSQAVSRRLKDTAFFGLRALWT